MMRRRRMRLWRDLRCSCMQGTCLRLCGFVFPRVEEGVDGLEFDSGSRSVSVGGRLLVKTV